MTGKKEPSGDSATSDNSHSKSNRSTRNASRKHISDTTDVPPSTSSTTLTSAEETSYQALPSECETAAISSGGSPELQLVPVHITVGADDYASYTQYPSSSSSVDSQYNKYQGDRGGSYSYNRHPPYSRTAVASTLPPEQISLNIQKNLEHCAQQQRQQFENIIRNNNEATQFLARGNLIIRMRGLPYDCTAKQVVDFFQSGENGVKLLDSEDGVLFVRKPDGRATGDAFALLSSDEDVTKALVKHRDLIGSRYIELFRSTPAEVMNRSMDIRHMDQQQQQQQHQPQPLPPLIAQLPALPPLLPQHSVAHGPKKDCVRLRGLPFEAGIEHVLEFLGEFAKSIIFRGVHMVYTPQGHPSGEAFIQMVNEQAAWACASGRHNRYMYFGKKHRYIEVFQCSGDDMNFVLSGANTSATGVGTPGAVPTAVSTPAAARSMVHTPGGSGMLPPYGAYPLGPAPTVIGHTLTPAHRLTPYPTQIHTAYPTMFYWPYPPSPPVSPTTGYYSSLHPHAIIPSECIPIHAPGELAMRPIEAVATM